MRRFKAWQSAASARGPQQVRLVAALSVVSALALTSGCKNGLRFWETAADLRGVRQVESEDPEALVGAAAAEAELPSGENPAGRYPAALAKDAWVQSLRPLTLPNDRLASKQSPYRWRHLSLDSLIATPADRRPDLAAALQSSDVIAKANTQIVLARWHDPRANAEELSRTAETLELRLAMREAAVESIAAIDTDKARDSLRSLADRAANADPQKYVPELHLTAIYALANKAELMDVPRFEQALASRSAEVRVEALDALARPDIVKLAKKSGEIPVALPGLAEDVDPRVRLSTMRALAAYRHPEAYEMLSRGLSDAELSVRLAAIAGLGELGGEQSKHALDQLKNHPSEVKRAAVVAALTALGADEALVQAATDKNSKVRQAVAQALAELPKDGKELKQHSVEVAKKLIADASGEVQVRAVQALAEWPIEEAGPILITAMSSSGYQARKEAAKQLSARWPKAASFPVDGAVERRAEAIALLQETWRAEFGSLGKVVLAVAQTRIAEELSVAPEQVIAVQSLLNSLAQARDTTERRQVLATLKSYGPQLESVLEQAAARQSGLPPEVFSEVLPALSSTYAVLEKLRSADLSERRGAATDLVATLAGRPLTDLELARLGQLVEAEKDPLVWQQVLVTTAQDARDEAVHLAYVAVGNTSIEVRKRACQYLEQHANPRHCPVLVQALKDPDHSVVGAAVRALGAIGSMDDPQPLLALLATPDRQLRLQVASSLARMRVQQGAEALTRLAQEADANVRRQVAVAMGDLKDPAYVPVLIALLDDRQEIQHAALTSLALVAGHDVALAAGATALAADQVRAWKQWHRDHDGVAPEGALPNAPEPGR